MNQWTPISTPPTDSGSYIVCEEYLEWRQHIGVEYYYHISDVWSRPNSITHWMELPLPPKTTYERDREYFCDGFQKDLDKITF